MVKPVEPEKVAEQVESWYERFHKKYVQFSERWREHTNRRTIVATVIVGLILGVVYIFAIRAPDTFPTGELVTIPEGESLSTISDTLYKSGVIRSPFVFRLIVKATRQDRTLHAGDYLFKEPLSVFSVARRVALGAFGLEPFRFRIQEGFTTSQMAALYSTVLQRFNIPASF